MDPLFATLVLILLALLGSRFSFSTRRVPVGPRLLFRTGVHFPVLGYLLGPGGLGLLSGDAVIQLEPLLALGLGWIGLLFGMQLDRDALRQFPMGYHLLALGQAALAYAFFLGIGLVLLELADQRSGGATLLLLGGAATASITTPAGVAMISSNFLARGRVRQLLFFIASVDALVGIVALQVAYALYHPTTPVGEIGPLPVLNWILVGVGLGVVCGIIFLWLLRPRPGREELVLYLLGIAALGSGAALQLQLSPIFVCVVMGTVVANLAPDRQRIFQALEKWEKPIYVVLLLLAGALVTVPTWWVLPLAAGYIVVRAVAKWSGSALLVPLIPLPFRAPRTLGLGLIPQGGISLALAVSVVLTYSGLTLPDGTRGVELLFAVIVLGVVVSE
ncbi:MAG TPA: cation:proton antiporter, partial [Longimicrobiales bacterium]|nr:cation:proton antiporter [Longimicrobiales bacterium]